MLMVAGFGTSMPSGLTYLLLIFHVGSKIFITRELYHVMNAKELEANHAYEAVVAEFSDSFEAVYGHHVEAGLTETLKALILK